MPKRLVHAMFTVVTAAAALAGQQQVTAADASFAGANGRVALSDYRGKQAVVLLFMRGFSKGMTCYYCGEQTRAYRDRYADVHAAGAEVLMVLPLADEIAGYTKRIGEQLEPPEPQLTLPFPVVIDADGSACAAFHVPTKKSGDLDPFPVSAPATIVIAKDGRILFEQHGDDPSDRPAVAKVLDVLRTGIAAAAATRPAATKAPARAWLALAEGLRAAQAARKPILLDFHAVW